MFIGEYTHTLDAKRRLAIPSKFRKELGRKAVIAGGEDKCLALYPMEEWGKVAGRLTELPTGNPDTRSFVRLFLSRASEVECDNLGRILIPDFLKSYAELGENIVITGVFRRIEIWNQKNWEEYKKKVDGATDRLAEKLGEIGAY